MSPLRDAIAWSSSSTRSSLYSSSQASLIDSTSSELDQVIEEKPTDFCKKRLLAMGAVSQFSAQSEISGNSQSKAKFSLIKEYPKFLGLLGFAISQQDDETIQALIKKYISETNAQDNVSKYSPNTAESEDSLRKRYADNVSLLRCASAQHSVEAIPVLIKICAHALDDINKNAQKNDSLIKQYLKNLKLLCCAFAQYSAEAIQALIKMCAHVLKAQGDIGKSAQKIDESNEYSKNLALLRSTLPTKNADSVEIRSLIEKCAHALDAQSDVIESKRNIAQYLENLPILQHAITQQNGEAIQALIKICVYEFNKQDNAAENPQDIEKSLKNI